MSDPTEGNVVPTNDSTNTNTNNSNNNNNNNSNKRKRGAVESPPPPDAQRINRSSNGSNNGGNIPSQANFAEYEAHASLGGADLNIDQQIFQHVGQNGINEETALTTAKAALAAQNPQQKYPPPPDATFDTPSSSGLHTHGLPFAEELNQSPIDGSQPNSSTAAAVYAAREAQNINQKPSVGSTEWHQLRKYNHKEGMIGKIKQTNRQTQFANSLHS